MKKKNLAYGIKSPLIVAHVLIRQASPFQKAGGEVYTCPGVRGRSPCPRL